MSALALDPAAHALRTGLISASTDLAMVRGSKLDSPPAQDRALSNLFSAASHIHGAIANTADKLPPNLPGGVTSFPRTAAQLVVDAAAEVQRGTAGRQIDVGSVQSQVDSAIARIGTAISLINHPPTDTVYDGS